MIPTNAKAVYDVSGAGDTVISLFTLVMAQSADPIDAALISNIAAGVVVSKFGTAVASREELIKAVKNFNQKIKIIQ